MIFWRNVKRKDPEFNEIKMAYNSISKDDYI